MLRHDNSGTAAGIILVLAAVLCGGAGQARAQALDMDQPEIKAGEREVRSVNVFNRGFRAGSTGEPRSSHEVGVAYSPVDWFKGIVHLDVESLIGEGVIADHVGFETFTLIRKAGEDGGLALTWYTGLIVSTDQLSTSSIVFGPIVKLTEGKASLTLNPYLEDTFGRNSGPGVNFAYGWQAKYELSERLSLGIEGFGKVENVGSAPVWDEQDHRIGPGIFLSWEGEGGRSYGLDFGVLAGLTDASPDVSFKVNFGVVH